jgi:hypothetical protein
MNYGYFSLSVKAYETAKVKSYLAIAHSSDSKHKSFYSTEFRGHVVIFSWAKPYCKFRDGMDS